MTEMNLELVETICSENECYYSDNQTSDADCIRLYDKLPQRAHRRHVRAAYSADVYLSPSAFVADKFGGKAVEGVTCDISEAGIGVILDTPINLEQGALVTLSVSDEDLTFEASAFLKAICPQGRRLGFEFYTLPKEVLSIVIEMIRKNMAKTQSRGENKT